MHHWSLPYRERLNEIKDLLAEVREYDGSSQPQYWLRTVKRSFDTLEDNNPSRNMFVRRLIAQKIKGPAQLVVDRIASQDMYAVEVAFGKIEQSYDQLAEQRNSMRPGATENTANYIKRYDEIHNRIQAAFFRHGFKRLQGRFRIYGVKNACRKIHIILGYRN